MDLKNVYLAVVRVNILVQTVRETVFALNVTKVGVLVKLAKVMGKSNVRIVTGLEILLMRNAMNVAAVGITNGIRNVEYAMVLDASSENAKDVMELALQSVKIVMVMEDGAVMNVTEQECVHTVRAKETLYVKPVLVLESAENVRARVRYGVLIAMVRDYALIAKEKNSLLVPVAMERENFKHIKSIHSLKMKLISSFARYK